MTDATLDLGSGHLLRFTGWAPDRDLNPQYADLPDVELFGATIEHRHHETGVRCVGAITFAGSVQDRVSPGSAKWVVEILDPLTIMPSILCGCGDHGWIHGGRWVS